MLDGVYMLYSLMGSRGFTHLLCGVYPPTYYMQNLLNCISENIKGTHKKNAQRNNYSVNTHFRNSCTHAMSIAIWAFIGILCVFQKLHFGNMRVFIHKYAHFLYNYSSSKVTLIILLPIFMSCFSDQPWKLEASVNFAPLQPSLSNNRVAA